MTAPNLIGIVDDDPDLSSTIASILRLSGFDVAEYTCATTLFNDLAAGKRRFDLILSDVNMPGLSGFELCAKIRTRFDAEDLPIILITGAADHTRKACGLELGADDLLEKPFHRDELLAKIRSLLRTRDQRRNSMWRLQRLLPTRVADLSSAKDSPTALAPYRGQATVVFFDLHGFTRFTEAHRPEDVISVLNSYYLAVEVAASRWNCTLGHLAGDGIMVFFDRPTPPGAQPTAAIQMALEARAAIELLRENWDRAGYSLDFGIGIESGEATIGGMGRDHFWHYSVIGSVPNRASRFCSFAERGQIIISQTLLAQLKPGQFTTETLGECLPKGFDVPIRIYNVSSEATGPGADLHQPTRE